MSLLITSSLIDAVAWAKTAPDSPSRDDPTMSWKQKGYFDLKNTLARIWTPGNLSVERGMRVEKAIYAVCNEKAVSTVKCSALFKEVLGYCNGGIFQKKTKSFIDIDNDEYCLFGKMDVFFPGKLIIDLKTTGKYGGRSKYLDTLQHKIYLYNEGLDEFKYIIMEFEEEGSDVIKDVHYVDYTAPSKDELKADIVKAVKTTMDFINMFDEPGDLKDLYLHKFNMYN